MPPPTIAALPRDSFAWCGESIAYWAERQPDAPAVAAALACEGPVVVDVRSSLEAISAYTTLTKLRGEA